MVQGDVDDLAVAAQEVGGLAMDVEEVQLLGALEDVESPVLVRRLPRLRRLVVLQHHALERLRLRR